MNSSVMPIQLPKEFGAKECRSFEETMDRKLAANVGSLILDLGQVERIDADGIDGLLQGIARAARHDVDLRIGAVSPFAATYLEFTGLDGLIETLPQVDLPALELPVASDEDGRVAV